MKNAPTKIAKFSLLKSQLQRRLGWSLLTTLLVLSFLAVVVAGDANFAGVNKAAQSSSTGEWLVDFSRKNPEEVQLTIVRRSSRGGQQTSSGGIRLSELQGLTREQAFGVRTDVNFRIVREAGTFQCEGYFREGKGAGFWTLTTNPNFVSAMRGRGYDNLTEDDLFSAAMHDISIKSIDDLKAAGYDHLSFKELVEASIFKVTSEFIRELKSAGFENLSLKELVEARIFKVDSQYVKEVEAMGFSRQPLKTLVEMRIHKITPEFINRMRSMGFDNLSIRELSELSVHHVTPEFVNGIKAEGFSTISPRQAIELKIHRVDGDFIRRVKAKGFNDVTLRQLVDLRINGIIK
jgi:uncharacterized protein (UPF0335 family)